MAYLLASQLSHQFIYQIDCRSIDKLFWKLWPEILQLENTVIILAHVERLNHAQTKIILEDNKRLAPIIVTYELNADYPELSSDWNSAYRTYMEPLSGRQDNFEEIIDVLTLHLNTLHEGKVSHYTTEAICILKDYQWPENYNELTNIIKSLVIKAKSSVINESEVKLALNQLLKQPFREDLVTNMIRDNHYSLEDYIEEIIRYKLEANQGKITKTANDLQISRSKIYRYLGNDEYHQ